MKTRQLVLVVLGVFIALFALAVSRSSSGESLTTLYDDEFDTAQLNARWSWIREDASHWSLTSAPGSLRIITQYGDLYQGYNNLKNLLLQPMPAVDFDIITRLTIDPVAEYHQAGVILYQDQDNYLKLVRAYDSRWGGADVVFALEQGGSFDHSFHQAIPRSVGNLYLKVSRRGSWYQGLYSVDGTSWTAMGEYSRVDFANPRFGLMASNGYIASAPEIPADFDFFHVKLDSLSDQWAVRTYNTDDAGGAFVNGVMTAGSMYSYYPDSGYMSANEFWRAGSDNFVSLASWDAGVCCGSRWGFALRKNNTVVWNTEGSGPVGERIAYAHILQVSKDGVVTDFNQIPPPEKLPGRWYVRVRATGGSAFALVDKLPVAGSAWNQTNLVEITQWLGKRNNVLHLNAWNDGRGPHQWSFAILKDGVTLWQAENTVASGARARSMYKQIVIDESGNVFEGAPPTPCETPFFWQRDPIWANHPLRSNGQCSSDYDTIGEGGCTLTSAAMVFRHLGARFSTFRPMDPPNLSDCMGSSACPFNWLAGSACTNSKAKTPKVYAFTWSQLDLEINRNQRPVILGMHLKGNLDDTHWVVVTRGQGSDPANYYMYDPWYKCGQNMKLSHYSGRYDFDWIAVYPGEAACSFSSAVPPCERNAAPVPVPVTAAADTEWPERQPTVSMLETALPTNPSALTGSILLYRATEITMTVELSATTTIGNVTEMLIWSDTLANATWQAYSPLAWLPLSDSVYVRFRNQFGDVSETFSDTTIPVAPRAMPDPERLYLPLSYR